MRTYIIASLMTMILTSTFGSTSAMAQSGVGAVGSGLASHRAVYDLSLKDASDRSGISGLSGRMVYEFAGNACEGYTVNFRFVTDIESDGTSRITDQQTTTFEDIKNQIFRFVTRSFVNQKLDSETRGVAKESGDNLEVKLEQPDKLTLDIAPAFFPTEHMIQMINKAKKGERFYESRIYDGSDEGNRAMVTTTILGKKRAVKADDAEAQKAGDLADKPYWPVSMSYFEEKSKGDELPTYTISFKLYDNGVTRDLTMDYGDFVLQGKLAQLDIYKPDPCEK